MSTTAHTYAVGDLIKFKGEKRRYTVKAASDRFLICTKPFPPKRTVIYSIVDFQRDVRGPDNLVFSPFNYAKQECIDECLAALIAGECEVSYRRNAPLEIESVNP